MSTTSKPFIKQTYDKFSQMTKTNSIPDMVKLGWDKQHKFQIGISHIKHQSIDQLMLSVNLITPEWLFIRHGIMSISIDSIETLSFKANEVITKVLGHSGDRDLGMYESVYYIIEKDSLLKICNSNDLGIRITGDGYVHDFSGRDLDNFKLMSQQFYNNFFDETSFLNSINQQVKSGKSACFVATATMGDYNNPKVIELRSFRDNWILKQKWGEFFVEWYYHYGAIAAKKIEKNKALKILSYWLIIKPLYIISKNIKK